MVVVVNGLRAYLGGHVKFSGSRECVCGAVPIDNWGELFRCLVGPAARMNLKKVDLGVQFQMEFQETGLDPNDAAVKAMKEAARRRSPTRWRTSATFS